eukprot:TRINITY_DN329_c0_g1_i4.p1 TRINITY_DN329_c0_g1~~TRINITY_DN329_c0_g1_i4.p1  ORF type:complete len:502 (+),score=46.54 TRINITY_DN329_c0_g1_i4:65-1507(+)
MAKALASLQAKRQALEDAEAQLKESNKIVRASIGFFLDWLDDIDRADDAENIRNQDKDRQCDHATTTFRGMDTGGKKKARAGILEQLKKELAKVEKKEEEERAIELEKAKAETERAKTHGMPHLPIGSGLGSQVTVVKPFHTFAQSLKEDEYLVFTASQISRGNDSVTVTIADRNGNERQDNIARKLLVRIAKMMLAKFSCNTLELNFKEAVDSSDSCSNTGGVQTLEDALNGSNFGCYNVENQQVWTGKYTETVQRRRENGEVAQVVVTCHGRADYVIYPNANPIHKGTKDLQLKVQDWILVEKESGNKGWDYGKHQLGLSLLGTLSRLSGRAKPYWGMFLSDDDNVRVMCMVDEAIFKSDQVVSIKRLPALCEHIFKLNLHWTGLSLLKETQSHPFVCSTTPRLARSVENSSPLEPLEHLEQPVLVTPPQRLSQALKRKRSVTPEQVKRQIRTPLSGTRKERVTRQKRVKKQKNTART